MRQKSSSSPKHRVIVLCLAIAGFPAASVLSRIVPDAFSWVDDELHDLLFSVRYAVTGKEKVSPYIVNIRFDDSSDLPGDAASAGTGMETDAAGYRFRSSRILERLARRRVESVSFDIIFAGNTDREADDALRTGSMKIRRVYFPAHCYPPRYDGGIIREIDDSSIALARSIWHPVVLEEGEPPSANIIRTVFPSLETLAYGLGHVNIGDRIPVRYVPLLYKYGDGYLPSLTFRQVCDYLEVPPDRVLVRFGKSIVLKNARFSQSLTKDIVIPVDRKGQVRLNIPGPWPDSYFSIEAGTFIGEREEVLVDFLDRRSLVLISDTTSRGKDYSRGIYDTSYPNTGIHLTIANMILTGTFVSSTDAFTNILVLLICGALVFLLASVIRTEWLLQAGYGLIILYLVFTLGIFVSARHLSPILEPVLGMSASVLLVTLYGLSSEKKEKNAILIKLAAIADMLVFPDARTRNVRLPPRSKPSELDCPVTRVSRRTTGNIDALSLATRLMLIDRDVLEINSTDALLLRALRTLEAFVPASDLYLLTTKDNKAWRGHCIVSGEAIEMAANEVYKLPNGEESDIRTYGTASSCDPRIAFVRKLELEDGVAVLGIVFPGNARRIAGSWRDLLALFCSNLRVSLGRACSLRNTRDAGRALVHEIKNTSASVRYLLSKVIKEVDMDSAAIARLTLITGEMARLYDFSTKHLDMEMLDNTGRLEKKAVDIAELMNRVICKNQAQASLKSISIELKLVPGLYLEGEEAYLHILFSNILENAVKYSPENSQIEIDVTGARSGVLFRFCDRGPGFPEESGRGRFQEKRNVLKSRLPFASSHGLGLELCRRIVEKHGGTIETENLNEGGAAVTVYLPER
jgi:signal transduction histidine kinase